MKQSRQPANAQKLDQQRPIRRMYELHYISDNSDEFVPGSLVGGTIKEEKVQVIKKVQVIILGHEPMSVIQRFINKFFPKRTKPSKKYHVGTRYMYTIDTSPFRNNPGYPLWHLRKGDRIGYNDAFQENNGPKERSSKPILEIVGFGDFKDIPSDVNALTARTTEFEIINEEYMLNKSEDMR